MIGSPQQLAEVLFVKLGLSRKRRGKTGFSTDARVLQAIRDEHPIVEKIERWRELTKLVQTYLEQLPAAIGPDGRLHTTLLQTNTATGRLASINPNLQNIPIRTEIGREIRACFIAEPGNALLSVDYSQVELRVLAHIAGEDVLKDIFRRGEDVHAETASAVFDVDARPTSPSACARRPRWSTSGSSTASPPTGSPTGCGSRRRRRRSSSTATSSASRPSRGSSQDVDHAGRGARATSRRCSAAAARCRRSARATGRRASSASGSRSTAIIQGTAADIIKVAMVRCHDKLAEAGPGDADDHADPRRAAVRGAGGRGCRARPRSSPPRWSARPRSTRRWPSTRARGRTGWPRSDDGGRQPRAPVAARRRSCCSPRSCSPPSRCGRSSSAPAR